MITNATAHRRAAAFARALEDRGADRAEEKAAEPPARAATDGPEAERDRMVALAEALGSVPAPELAAEVKTVQRARLVAAMEAAFAEGAFESDGTVPEQRGGRDVRRPAGLHRYRPRTRWGRRLAAGGLSVGVAASAFGGMAVASADALPGDTLYGLKRGMEDLRLDLADDGTDRGRLHLDLASTRMQEARRLMDRARVGELDDESVQEVGRTLTNMHDEAAEGHRLLSDAYRRDGSLKPIESLSAFSTVQSGAWADLRDRLPDRLAPVRDQVSSVLDAIERDVAPLQSLLPTPSSTGDGSSTRTGGAPQSPDAGTPSPSGTDPSGTPGGNGPNGSGTGEPDGGDSSGSAAPDGEDGGTGGGLLDPPALPGTGEDGDEPSDGGNTEEPDAEITLPPLLPGLLPGLGIGGGDD
ncbi:DUF5667 domain-containing protein [Streptomyces thermolineatus]|uniref:DUF5667 domain-containing protein n=1 Tax=Streptomyces thermolineatus TaxID=44033 RepID=UPI00384A8402